MTKHEEKILSMLLSPDIKNIAIGLAFMKNRSVKTRREILKEFMLNHIGKASTIFSLTLSDSGKISKYRGFLYPKYYPYKSEYVNSIDFWTINKVVKVKPFFKGQECEDIVLHKPYYFQYEIINNENEYHLVRQDKAWDRLYAALNHLVNHILANEEH